MKLSDLERRRTAAVVAVVALLLVLQVWAFSGLPHDDAFITYRYGENCARGRGLVFNPGERVLGFTSPLHVLVAAGLHAAVGHAALPRVLAALGCAAWTAQSLVVARLLTGALERRAAWVVGALIAVGGVGSQRWVALETNLAVALSLGALALALEDRWRAAALVAGLACLARPDAGIMALLLAAYGTSRLRARMLVPGAVFLAVVLPWVVFATVYFGSPVPEPLRVKFQRTGLGEYLVHVLREGPLTLWGVEAPSAWLVAVTWLFAVAGAAVLVRRERPLGLLVAYGLLHLVSYLYLRPFRAHEWHLYPGLLVLGVCSWSCLLQIPARRFRIPGIVALLAICSVRTLAFARQYPTAYWFGARDQTYRAAGEFLRANVRPGERVAAVEVGTLGYFSDATLYDLGGLITRAPVIAARPPRPYAWLAVDSHYPSLEPEGEAPVREWTQGFPLKLYRLK